MSQMISEADCWTAPSPVYAVQSENPPLLEALDRSRDERRFCGWSDRIPRLHIVIFCEMCSVFPAGPPATREMDARARRGGAVFDELRCRECHAPRLNGP